MRAWVSKQCEMISWWDNVNASVVHCVLPSMHFVACLGVKAMQDDQLVGQCECFPWCIVCYPRCILLRAWVSKQYEMISWWDDVNASLVHCVLPLMHFVACLGVKAMRDDQLVGQCECFPWCIVCYPRCILMRAWVSKQCEMISWWDNVNASRGALCVTLDAFCCVPGCQSNAR